MLTWLDETGYLMGGHGQGDAVYSLVLSFDGAAFHAHWSVLAPAGPAKHRSEPLHPEPCTPNPAP